MLFLDFKILCCKVTLRALKGDNKQNWLLLLLLLLLVVVKVVVVTIWCSQINWSNILYGIKIKNKWFNLKTVFI